MTPLKIASRAYVNAGTESGNSEKTIYDAFSDRDQKEADDAMRAALLALVEMGNDSLPDVTKTADQFSPFPDAFANARKDAFKRILQNIAGESSVPTNNREAE